MNNKRLKVPVEMAQYALSYKKVSEVRSYLSAQFLYSGHVRVEERPTHTIASLIECSERTVYKHFKWLLQRKWIQKNEVAGWYHFIGLNRIHEMENWMFARAAVMTIKDLQKINEYLVGVVLASLAITQNGRRQRSEPAKGQRAKGSETSAASISLKGLADVLNVSVSTAQRWRNASAKAKYIENMQNLVRITNWSPGDLIELRKQGLKKIPVELVGESKTKRVRIERIRYYRNKLYLQEPNKIKARLRIKPRRGLSYYSP